MILPRDDHEGVMVYLVVLAENPSHASIPPYQNGTMAKDACRVWKVLWRRERALDRMRVRAV